MFNADPRPSEVEGSTVAKEQKTFEQTEGTDALYSRIYTLPVTTELQLKRTFTQPGQTYKVILFAENMHNEEDVAIMEWYVGGNKGKSSRIPSCLVYNQLTGPCCAPTQSTLRTGI